MQINYATSRVGVEIAQQLLERLGVSVGSANPTQSY